VLLFIGIDALGGRELFKVSLESRHGVGLNLDGYKALLRFTLSRRALRRKFHFFSGRYQGLREKAYFGPYHSPRRG